MDDKINSFSQSESDQYFFLKNLKKIPSIFFNSLAKPDVLISKLSFSKFSDS